jgi:Rps23 Pro-64 3,4-dihydroxylase Tpa1-like proline 4-hydroxylase
MLTARLDSVKTALKKQVHDADERVNDLTEQKNQEVIDGEDTTKTESDLAAAKKSLATARKALADYEASVNAQNLQKASTAKNNAPATDESSHSTGSDSKAANTKPKKKGSWSLRSRGPQAQAVR